MEVWLIVGIILIALGIFGAGVKEAEFDERIRELEKKVEVLMRPRG